MASLILLGVMLVLVLWWPKGLPHYFWIKRDDPYWDKKGEGE